MEIEIASHILFDTVIKIMKKDLSDLKKGRFNFDTEEDRKEVIDAMKIVLNWYKNT